MKSNDFALPSRFEMSLLRLPAVLILLGASAFSAARAEPTRADVLAIAESFRAHQWQATAKNRLHGKDASGIDVQTPDRKSGVGHPAEECWEPDVPTIGLAYKWGGFDTPASFDAGLRAGKAAGDIYTQEKRRRGGAAVSRHAVGIDCSGFISRCWKLARKYSTDSLGDVSRKLAAPSEMEPGDIMNQPGGHVLLFARWLDRERTRALFYEAAPFSKVRTAERAIAELVASGFSPLRYRKIRG